MRGKGARSAAEARGRCKRMGLLPLLYSARVSILSFSVLCAFIQNGKKENAGKGEGRIGCV